MYILKQFLGDKYDKVNTIIDNEYNIIKENAVLIGSANYPFSNVLASLDAPLTFNPYEGFPGNRYFPKTKNIDELELMGEKLTKEFFNIPDDTDYKVSLQPYSGTQANQIVYNACLNYGDTILALKTNCGGHVSHTTFSEKYFKLISYGIGNNELIDYNEIEYLARLVKPKLIIAGASSYPRAIRYDILGDMCKKYNILLLADISHTALYTSSNLHVSPFGIADFITFTTHKTTRGIRGGIIVYKKKYSKNIEHSIFPISQGAPKFTEILAKVVMFIELSNIDKKAYSNKVIGFAQKFNNYLLSNNIKTYTSGTDMHYVVLNLLQNGLTGEYCESQLEKINILVNRNSIPNDPAPPRIASGLRVGFLTLATLDFSNNDFDSLIEILYEHLFTNKKHHKDEVINIMKKYPVVG